MHSEQLTEIILAYLSQYHHLNKNMNYYKMYTNRYLYEDERYMIKLPNSDQNLE